MFWLFILYLIIVIIMHELGHLISAKLVGCGVDKFSIGFGKPLFSKKFGETVYQITPWLFGGYCSLVGETENSDNSKAFSNIRYRSKVILITAGCLVNIITGGLILGILKYYGIENYNIFLFGYLSLVLGITNLIPFPALDGSYPFLVLLEKFMGKEKDYELMGKIITVGFNILMVLNVVSVIWAVWYWRNDILIYIVNLLCYIANFLMRFIA